MFSVLPGQSLDRLNKSVLTAHDDLVKIRGSQKFKLHSVKLLNEKTALVGYKPLDDRIPPYKNGCLCIPAMVTAKARILLTKLATDFEDSGYVVAYCDTGASLFF